MKRLFSILLLLFVVAFNVSAVKKAYTAKDTTINGAQYIVISGCSESKTADMVLVNKTSGKVLIDKTHLDLLNKYLNGKLSSMREMRTLSYSITPLFSTYKVANNNHYRRNAWFYLDVIVVTSSIVTNSETMQPDDVVGNVTLPLTKEEFKALLSDWLIIFNN